MRVRFLGQPFADGGNLREFLAEVAANESLENLTACVAWVTANGLTIVESDLAGVRARGRINAIVGIDEGTATAQGLERAVEVFDSVHVFHERTARTFHPKIFVAWGPTTAWILVGSNNFTAGGLYYNYEASTVVELDRSDSDDEAVLQDALGYIDLLYQDEQVCLELTPERLTELITNPRYRIRDENAARTFAEKDAPESVDSDVDVEGNDGNQPAPSMFGASQHAKKSAPRRAKKAQAPPRTAPPPPPTLPAPTATPTYVTKRWHKVLTHSDAQQRRTAQTQITGNLKLGAAHHDIDQKTYFRDVFFDQLPWAGTPTTRGVKETATFHAEVVVHGASLGMYAFRVDHAAYRVANQNNVPTWLHWDAFGGYLRDHNMVDEVVTLERRSDDTFRVSVEDAPTGPFIP